MNRKQQSVEDIFKKHGLVEFLKTIKEKENDDDDGEDAFEFLSQFAEDNQDLEDRGIIFINGGISKETLARVSRKILSLHFDQEFKEDVQIILNSPGGYTDAGWAFIDLMSFCANRIVTVAMGEVCSMGASIFMAGDHRVVAPNTSMMVHHFRGAAIGSYPELLAGRKGDDIEHHRELDHLLMCSKYKTIEEVKKHILLDQDHWLSPKEIKEHGLCDQIYTPRQMSTKGVEKRLAKAREKLNGTKSRRAK